MVSFAMKFLRSFFLVYWGMFFPWWVVLNNMAILETKKKKENLSRRDETNIVLKIKDSTYMLFMDFRHLTMTLSPGVNLSWSIAKVCSVNISIQ